MTRINFKDPQVMDIVNAIPLAPEQESLPEETNFFEEFKKRFSTKTFLSRLAFALPALAIGVLFSSAIIPLALLIGLSHPLRIASKINVQSINNGGGLSKKAIRIKKYKKICARAPALIEKCENALLGDSDNPHDLVMLSEKIESYLTENPAAKDLFATIHDKITKRLR